MSIRPVVGAVALLALTMLAAACGSGSEPSSAGGETAGAASEAPVAEAPADDAATGDPTAAAPAAPSSEDPAGSEPPGELETLTYVGSAAVPGSTQVALYAVPTELGFFADEGLEVDLQLADGSTAALQAVASGSGAVTNSEVGSTISAAAGGVPVKNFTGIVQNWPWRIGVPPESEIEAPEDLRGQSIGIISLASGSNLFARAWLEQNGLVPEQDVAIAPVGTGPQALSALQSGQVQALAHYTELYAGFENEGQETRFLDNPELFDGLTSIGFASTGQLIEDDPELLTRYARAAYRGLLFAAANPEAATRISYEYFPEKLPPSGDPEENLAADANVLEAWLESATPQEGEPADWQFGEITPEGWAKVQEYGLASGQLEGEVPIDQVWTDELLDGINDFDRQEVLDLAEEWTPDDLS